MTNLELSVARAAFAPCTGTIRCLERATMVEDGLPSTAVPLRRDRHGEPQGPASSRQRAQRVPDEA
jgi:hypothetical protein